MRSIYFLSFYLFLCQFAQGYASPSVYDVCLNFESTICQSDSVEKRVEKSSLEITYPNSTTAWTIDELAKIEWKTKNIGSEKSIRFFLTRNDMVVQELGTFKNSFTADGIKLAKNIGSGDTYQVVGIELFPDNKYSIAKFATPYFSIINAAADARKIASTSASSQKNKDIAKPTEFDGRNISYVKEVVFESENISIDIWDHGRQDNDIVSIYLNGETIISKHLLTYRKKSISVKLNTNKSNNLLLYAHNLGKAPPNTVSIEITDGATSEKIILNSDLKSCEAVLISVNK